MHEFPADDVNCISRRIVNPGSVFLATVAATLQNCGLGRNRSFDPDLHKPSKPQISFAAAKDDFRRADLRGMETLTVGDNASPSTRKESGVNTPEGTANDKKVGKYNASVFVSAFQNIDKYGNSGTP